MVTIQESENCLQKIGIHGDDIHRVMLGRCASPKCGKRPTVRNGCLIVFRFAIYGEKCLMKSKICIPELYDMKGE